MLMNNLRVTRHIFLMRHAQSAEKQPGQADRARTLTSEGEESARKTGLKFHRLSVQPDYLLSSSAMRASMTADCVNESLSLSADRMSFVDELYEATTDDWEQQLRLLPSDSNSVLCIGHNPVLSLLASDLAHRNIDLKPGAFVAFTSTADTWAKFRIGLTELSPSTIQ
jgi:phosphohistidine phosphatase